MKKGNESVQQILLVISSLLVGALVIWALPNMVSSSITDTNEAVMAKDLALTLMTNTGAGNLRIDYSPNTEKYLIQVEDKKVNIRSLDGRASSDFMPIATHIVTNTRAINTLSLPIYFRGREIFFANPEIDDVQEHCDNLPFIPKQSLRVHLSSEGSGDAMTSRNRLQADIRSHPRIEIVSLNDDPDLIISFRPNQVDNRVRIQYHESENYRKVACYVALEFEDAISGPIQTRQLGILVNQSIDSIIGALEVLI